MGRVISSIGSGCTSCPSSSGKSFTFDSRYRIKTATDAEGGVAEYTYDSRGNIETLIQGKDTGDERTTTFTWHTNYNLPLTVTRPSVSGGTVMDEYGYDATGNLRTLTENKTGTTERTTTFTWNTSGQMKSIDGPRTDVTDTVTFDYYPNDISQGLNRGMLQQITNGAGHVTTFSQYNGFGKPEQAEDANNVITTYVYDARGRMTSQSTSGVTTGYTYDDAGRLTKITLPGSREITYAYTDANLLEKITDNAGYSGPKNQNSLLKWLKVFLYKATIDTESGVNEQRSCVLIYNTAPCNPIKSGLIGLKSPPPPEKNIDKLNSFYVSVISFCFNAFSSDTQTTNKSSHIRTCTQAIIDLMMFTGIATVTLSRSISIWIYTDL